MRQQDPGAPLSASASGARPRAANPLIAAFRFIDKTLVIAEMEARKLRHDPTELITRAVQPALWLLVFGFNVKTTDVCSGMYLLETEEARKYTIQEGGFIVEIEMAAQSASTENLTEVPISYRPRVGTRKLNTWRDGLAILSAAFRLARRHNPILLYSSIAGLSIVPAALILGWVVLEQLIKRTFHSGWALAGIMLLLVAAQAFTLAGVSMLTRHSEERLMKEIRRHA